MLFLITHITFHKYYPKLFTQFVIGSVFYVIMFLFLKEIIDWEIYDQYRIHFLFLLVVDILYLCFVSRQNLQLKFWTGQPQNTELQSEQTSELKSETGSTLIEDVQKITLSKTDKILQDKSTDLSKSKTTHKPSKSTSPKQQISTEKTSESIPVISLTSSEINDYKIIRNLKTGSESGQDLFMRSENELSAKCEETSDSARNPTLSDHILPRELSASPTASEMFI